MKKVLIFGGTTEGRQLAQLLAETGVSVLVCVATSYGEQVMDEAEKSCNIQVQTGRLNCEEMLALFETEDFQLIIDATHPFATAVSENIRKSLQKFQQIHTKKQLSLIRLERQTKNSSGTETAAEPAIEPAAAAFFSSVQECVQALEKETGTVFLTTGSKNLAEFCASEQLKPRLVVRVLPGMESLKICYDCGLEGRQIIAMQGPFSEKMNRLQLEETKAAVLVTKESGNNGGYDEKVSAALKSGIKCFVIKSPSVENAEKSDFFYMKVSDLSSAAAECERILGQKIKIKNQLEITLAGIGMGSPETMTIGVHKKILEADYVFGAERMLESVNTAARKKEYYLAKDIIPFIKQLLEKNYGGEPLRIVVLFSGDSGFYSGAAKLKNQLETENFCDSQTETAVKIEILPGISSVQYLAAKTGQTWQNCRILSTHGIEAEEWKRQLAEYLKTEGKIFFITSGAKDVREIAAFLNQQIVQKSCRFQTKIILGRQLSYSDEKIFEFSLNQQPEIPDTGLYSGFIVVE